MAKHITEQRWTMKRETLGGGNYRVLVVGEDGSEITELRRPDNSSNELIAGYIVGIHLKAIAAREKK